jgi:hypothetical protein
VQNTTKNRILDALSPVLVGFGFIVKVLYSAVFSWWLDPWLQRKANRALLDDVQSNMYFLVSQAKAVNSPSAVLPFDYSSVEVLWENLYFVITRGRGDVSVSVAPAHARNELNELGPTIAALEGRHFSEHDVVHDLGGAADLLRPRLALLNSAFSEQEYPRTKARI